MAHLDRITIQPGKRSGKPCIRGLRMTVSDVLDYLASGMSEEDLLRDFPDLTREDIRACLAFAADRRAATGCGRRTVKLLLDQNLSPRALRPPSRHLDRCRSRSSGWLSGGGRCGRLGVREAARLHHRVEGRGLQRSFLPVRCAAEGHLAGARQLFDQRRSNGVSVATTMRSRRSPPNRTRRCS